MSQVRFKDSSTIFLKTIMSFYKSEMISKVANKSASNKYKLKLYFL